MRGRLLLAERFEGAAGRRAHVSLYETERALALRMNVANAAHEGDAWHYARSLYLDIGLAHPAACTIRELGPASSRRWWASWDLCSGNRREAGAFHDAFWWCRHELFDSHIDGDAGLERLEALLQVSSDRAIALSDPTARERAMCLSPGCRFFAYAALLSDPTGRVGQMIDVCPALLTLAAGRNRAPRDLWELITGITLGRKLSELIELIFVAEPAPWPRHARQLIKRAPPMSIEELLLLLRAPGADLNDLDAAGDRAREWFSLMAAWGREASRLADRPRAERLGGFFSRHALTLQEHDAPASLVAEVLDWLEHSNAPVPSRTSAPWNVRRAIENWHATLHHRIEHDPATPLATAPTPARRVEGIHATPLETVGQLVAEGLEMQNCVGAFADDAIAGAMHFYRGTIGDRRVTIAITGRPGWWQLHEAAGASNRRLDVLESEAVERWVAALR